jgi:Macrocin-O-methyltransferase (TylF)
MTGFLRRAAIYVSARALARLPFWLLEVAIFRAVLTSKFPGLVASRKLATREQVWQHAVDTVGASRRVLVLEFGVYKGRSIKFFASRLTAPESRLYGFDSFEGLPEDWSKKKAGKFTTAGEPPVVDDPRISFVKGWFQDTLPGFSVDPSAFEAVLVHLDADLYSSTLFVLSNLWGRLPSFHVVFDEFSPDEARALYNFSQAYPVHIEFLAHDLDANPQRVFCRIERAGVAPGAAS